MNKYPTLHYSHQAYESPSSSPFSSEKNNQFPTIWLSDVDEDVGHTLMHYLYTGHYQTLKLPSVWGVPKRTIEYTRSVLVYRTALNYGLKPLEDLAKRYMEIFDQHIHVFDIIRLARKHFPNVVDNKWYFDYLTERILAAFDANEEVFHSEQYFEGFGEAPEFDTFLGKTIALAYSRKISAMRSEAVPNVAAAADPVPPGGVDDTLQNGPTGGDGEKLKVLREGLKYPEQRCSFQAPESEFNYNQEARARRGTDLCIKPESEGYGHPVKNGGQICVTEDAESEYLQSSRVSMVTPGSDFGGDSPEQAHSGSEIGLRGYKCPDWQTHLRDERFYKNCKACHTCIRQMFVDLVE